MARPDRDVSYRLPSYPDRVGGFETYTTVIDDGVRTAAEFRAWLVTRGLPEM